MQELRVDTEYNGGRFFRGNVRNSSDHSSSLGFSMIASFLALSFLNMARAINAPNPFTFIQNNTLFSLFTDPEVNAKDHYIGWPAYESLVNAVVSGETGPITQATGTYYAKLQAWYVEACDLNIMLDTNGTLADAQPFLDRFNQTVVNNTILAAARSKSPDECAHLSKAEVAITTIAIIIGASLTLLAIRAFCMWLCSDRRNYVPIGEPPSVAAEPAKQQAYLAQRV